MKLGSKDVAYSSLDLDDPTSPSFAMRRNTAANASTGSLQSTVSSSSTSIAVDTLDGPHAYFAGGSGGGSPRRRFNDSEREHSALHSTLAALEGPIRQLTVEVKGALLATGCVSVRALASICCVCVCALTERLLVCLLVRAMGTDSQRRATCSRGSKPCLCPSSSPSSSCTSCDPLS